MHITHTHTYKKICRETTVGSESLLLRCFPLFLDDSLPCHVDPRPMDWCSETTGCVRTGLHAFQVQSLLKGVEADLTRHGPISQNERGEDRKNARQDEQEQSRIQKLFRCIQKLWDSENSFIVFRNYCRRIQKLCSCVCLRGQLMCCLG